MKSFVLSGIVLGLLLAACAAPAGAALISQPVSATLVAVEIPTSLYTPTVLVFPTPAFETVATPETGNQSATARPTPVSSAAPDVTLVAPAASPISTSEARMAPEKWQQWPVVPALTTRGREIYQNGLKLGNNPHVFAKVGDCQCVNAAFFGIYDQAGAYTFPPGYEFLQQTVDWFGGSFNRTSQAVRGGFNVASVFVPLQADPQFCQSGETPLACEFRISRPSLVLISMETGFEGRTAAVYEKYMRQIIETAIAKGALPILATKADNFEGDHSINLTTARLAVEYDLPLWNFWRAVQPLPNHGLDAERPDNFHISVEAWNVRSFTGLQALDAIWRGVRGMK